MAFLSKEQILEVVAISAIENFLCDAVGNAPDKATFDQKIGQVCQEFVDTVKVCAKRLPSTMFLNVKPLPRPRHKWFMDAYEDIAKFLLKAIHSLKLKNLKIGECVVQKDLAFHPDQFTLT